MHGGDRNRTSPFAFTGNKFEFRALGSSQSLALPNTVLNTIVAEAIDELADKLEAALDGGASSSRTRSSASSGTPTRPTSRSCFDGDNYSEEWHAEAERRGLTNLPRRPTRCRGWSREQTVEAFERYDVLSERELESRFEVFVEQYVDEAQHRGGDGRGDRAHDAAARRGRATSASCRRPGSSA